MFLISEVALCLYPEAGPSKQTAPVPVGTLALSKDRGDHPFPVLRVMNWKRTITPGPEMVPTSQPPASSGMDPSQILSCKLQIVSPEQGGIENKVHHLYDGRCAGLEY